MSYATMAQHVAAKRTWRQAKRQEHESKIDRFIAAAQSTGWSVVLRVPNRGTTSWLKLERNGVQRIVKTPRGWTP